VFDIMDIGEVRSATGLSTATLHHYEQLGLIASCGRAGLRRQYPDEVVHRLSVIVLCKRAGFSLDEISELLNRVSHKQWHPVAEAKVAEIDQRIADLQLAKSGIEHALNCRSDDIMTCEHFQSALHGVFSQSTDRSRHVEEAHVRDRVSASAGQGRSLPRGSTVAT
jgi:MerR family transcriptional regulator, copper efflux regulator